MENKEKNSETPRLFFAVAVPEVIGAELENLKKRIHELKKRDFTKLHITLRFLGDTPADLIAPMESLVRESLEEEADHSPFSLTAKGLFTFRKRPPAALFVGLAEENPLEKLRGVLDSALKKLPGTELKDDVFRPHITLTRLRRPFSNTLTTALAEEPRVFGTFEVREFFLFKSELLPGGARHTALARFPLK
ncbi:MAG: RNA 2',3'-cyclic phosphodiesterase [Deltaproteobacteria bacterium]|jgi:2'-5' RNA ligase|nr:RNA 2',3'-cyclic phosphodiesterase [Deltaproteobacteria bacterium]